MLKGYVNKLLGSFGFQIKRKDALAKERSYLDLKFSGAVNILKSHQKGCGKELDQKLECMVFSKDRAMQLHALLSSYFDKVTNHCPLVILYKTSNEKSRRSYNSLKVEFQNYPVLFQNETDFRKQVIGWLQNSHADRIFFMTDDAIFLDKFDMNDSLLFNPLNTILSLTKGFDKTFCFALNQEQQIPSFFKRTQHNGNNLNLWHWDDVPDSPDWSYPLSVDGNIFHREELSAALNHLSFSNPNTLEASMQVFLDLFSFREGACYDKVKLVNVPCNIVQKEFHNRSTNYFSIEELQNLWDEGKRIDISAFNGMSADEACKMKFTFLDESKK